MPYLFVAFPDTLTNKFMQQYPFIKRLNWHLICLAIISLSSCQKGELNLGDDFINIPTYTALIDTVTMQLSTIRNDSVVTSNTGSALIGYHQHPIMGGQEAKSFFNMIYPTEYSWDTDEQVFDSLVMVLHYNGYSIGDTTCDAHFNIHRLLQKIETHDDGNLYNTSAFSYEESPLATKHFRSYPVDDDKITIRLNDAFAHEIIDFLNTYSNHVDKSELFEDEFKGLVLSCDTNITRAALGFMVNDTSNYMRLYSHKSELEQNDIINDISLSSSSLQFNQLTSHDQSVVFNQIPDGKSTLKAQDSDHIVLLQSGTGLKFRADFPSLNSLLELKNKGYIVKAELRLKPDMNRMKVDELPPQLYIGDIYRTNEVWGYLTDTDGNPITSQLYIDYIYNEDIYYTFDITNYLNNRLQDDIIDTDQGLIFTLPESNMGSTYTWLAINGQSAPINSSELLLYYYYYDTE